MSYSRISPNVNVPTQLKKINPGCSIELQGPQTSSHSTKKKSSQDKTQIIKTSPHHNLAFQNIKNSTDSIAGQVSRKYTKRWINNSLPQIYNLVGVEESCSLSQKISTSKKNQPKFQQHFFSTSDLCYFGNFREFSTRNFNGTAKDLFRTGKLTPVGKKQESTEGVGLKTVSSLNRIVKRLFSFSKLMVSEDRNIAPSDGYVDKQYNTHAISFNSAGESYDEIKKIDNFSRIQGYIKRLSSRQQPEKTFEISGKKFEEDYLPPKSGNENNNTSDNEMNEIENFIKNQLPKNGESLAIAVVKINNQKKIPKNKIEAIIKNTLEKELEKLLSGEQETDIVKLPDKKLSLDDANDEGEKKLDLESFNKTYNIYSGLNNSQQSKDNQYLNDSVFETDEIKYKVKKSKRVENFYEKDDFNQQSKKIVDFYDDNVKQDPNENDLLQPQEENEIQSVNKYNYRQNSAKNDRQELQYRRDLEIFRIVDNPYESRYKKISK